MQILYFLFALVVLIGLLYAGYRLYMWWLKKQNAQPISSDDLEKIRPTAQIIDVREEPEFNARHILGARNIPASQFASRVNEVRRDKPVYLYDESENVVGRPSRLLKKAGHKEIYYLEKGIVTWTGKVKSSR